jgi:uncharacterized protein YceK
VAVEIRLKKGARMRKIFAGFLMTVMLLSGCGVAKNLEDPGSKPAPTPEASRSVWDHLYSEVTVINAVKISIVALCYGVFLSYVYVSDYMMNDWFNNKIFDRPRTKDIRGSIPKIVQNLPLQADE